MNRNSPSGLATRTEVIELLSRHHIVPTQQRVEIGRLLFARPQHFSADRVMEMVEGSGASVSKATVYNTLGLFAARGLLRQVIVDPSRVFYDTTTAEHPHFFNVDTGELTDISDSGLIQGHLPTPPEGTEIEGVDVVIRVRGRRQ